MNKCKLFCLLLCCSLVCLNGFSPVVSKAYLTGVEYNRWYLRWGSDLAATAKLYDNTAGASKFDKDLTLKTDINAYFVGNTSAYASSNYTFSLGSDELNMFIPFLWDVYDYYLLFTMSAATSASSEFTWNPTELSLITYTDARDRVDNMVDFELYCYCSDITNGFTAVASLQELSNYNISWIEATGTGTLPKSIYTRAMIVEVPKSNGSDGSDVSTLVPFLESIEQAIIDEGNEITEVISKQYEVQEDENFGVEDIVEQVNEKAGVLSFGTDTLVNFLDLFDAANATNTEIVFPGFSMEVQGVKYQVWPDYAYDLSELETQFGALIEVVRWGCVMAVWLAVLNYLVKAYDTIFGR